MITFMTLTGGCISEKSEDKRITANDSLISLMADIHLTEARLMQIRARGDNADTFAERLYDSLFEYHNCTRSSYEMKLKALTANPEEYIQTYDSVIARIERLKK